MIPVAFSSLFSSLLPIFLLIVTGTLSRRYLFQDAEFWDKMNEINFKLLIPSIIIASLAHSNIYAFSGGTILAVIGLVYLVFIIILSIIYYLFVPHRIDAPAFSSLFQTTTRWNVSLALVVAGLILDDTAMTIIALVMTLFIPMAQITNVVMMIIVLGKDSLSLKKIGREIYTHPIILGCVIGIFIAVFQIPIPSSILKGVSMLGDAAMVMILLIIGSGLSQIGFYGKGSLIGTSVFLKLIFMPVLVLFFGFVLHLSPEITMVMAIALSMPSATNGYVIARQMGGDAPLYASSCTAQTLIVLITAPLWIYLLPRIIPFLL